MSEALIRLLESTGFDTYPDGRWELSPKPRTHRYLSFWVDHQGERPAFCISAQEWRGGEGFDETVFRSESEVEALAAIHEWAAWAREPFVRTPWQRWRDRWLGRHWLEEEE